MVYKAVTSVGFMFIVLKILIKLDADGFYASRITNVSKLKSSHSIPYSALRMNQHRILNVDLGNDRSYPIYIGNELLNDGEVIRIHVDSKKVLIVTNENIGPLYCTRVREALEKKDVEVFIIELPDGERYKNMDVLMTIIDKAMKCKLDRKSTFIALGGGVVGDMTGFAAAIFQRGVNFIQIPTTVMAMVDSAVGGKTAVNHPLGKNMVGAFYQPKAVIADVTTLDTLPDREFYSGLSEIVKYGLIRDAAFFEWQEEHMDEITKRNSETLIEAIYRSCANKAAVVAADEKEAGIRATLNLGHTFAHAVEAGMGYGAWLHGEAVAVGMVMAAQLSAQEGLIDHSIASRATTLLRRAHLPTSLTNVDARGNIGEERYSRLLHQLTSERFLELMSVDKKVANGRLSLVLLAGALGGSVVTDQFDSSRMSETVSRFIHEAILTQ